jgi:hypothetical protein
MKTITILSLLLLLSFSQNSEKVAFDKCMVKLTKQDLLADVIDLHCASFADNENFSIEGFTIKFPGFPPEVIEESSLSDVARLYVQKLKTNQMVSIFDIKSAYLDGKRIQEKNIPSFYVKIIEQQIATVD